MMHVFCSGSVSGPEKLVLPSLLKLQEKEDVTVVFLVEVRLGGSAYDAAQYAKDLGIKTEVIEVEKRYDRRAISELGELFRERTPEIVHAHDVKATFYTLSARRKSRERIRVCSTHHGIYGRPDLTSRLYELFYRYLCLPFCDRILAVSFSDLKVLQKQGEIKEKSFLHLNGIGDPYKESDRSKIRDEVRREWRESEGTLLLGWIGRLSEEKGPFFLIDVVNELKSNPLLEDISWKVLVFGDGQLRGEIEGYISQYKLSSSIVLKGYDENIERSLLGLDILLNTSDHEGLPISLLEGAHAEIPLCVRVSGGIEDLIPEEKYGVRVPLGASPHEYASEVVKLMLDASKQSSLKRALRGRVQEFFSQSRWLSELENHYSHLSLLRSEPAVTCTDRPKFGALE